MLIKFTANFPYKIVYSLVFRPRPAFSTENKRARLSFLISALHNLKKIHNKQAAFHICSTNYTLNAWCVRQSPSASWIQCTCGILPTVFALLVGEGLEFFLFVFYVSDTTELAKMTFAQE